MGSKRFYEHTQNLLGGVKGCGHYLNMGGSWDYLIGGVGIIGIDMPNCLCMSFYIKTRCVK